jgi:penicillin G amidase
MKKLLKILGGIAIVLLLVVAIGGAWFWQQLNASIPQYDGELALAGLVAPVTVERDALGVVTIRSDNRFDEARALGFVHAQERFFQMDLLRRSAAGELSALVGAGALRMDEQRRRHRLRATARATIAQAPAEYRALVAAYTEGVNEGLHQLGAKPFEYLLLRVTPEPWRAEDTLLTIAAMYFDLQGGTGLHKRSELVAREVLPAPIADLMYPRRTTWDAPLVGEAGPPPVVPSAEVYDLRTLPREWFEGTAEYVPPAPVGSNNWAVAGVHTADGRGLLANDMHLGLQVPSIWFRTSLRRDGTHVTGVSLPGTPMVVVGSNGRVAWGFTNSYGDWMDLIVLEVDPEDDTRYRTPDGWRAFEEVEETIEVAGGESRTTRFRVTDWGPVMGELADGRPYALRWLAHDPRGYAPGYFDLQDADNVDEAVAAAQRSGIPAQNFVVADADGDIAWTIMGQIPRRLRDATAASYSATGPAWDGWLEPDEYPLVRNPEYGRVWTANARVVDGEMLAQVGDGGYAMGQRARQIRDRLLALEDATPADMLRIQLDDEALFHARWRTLLLALLDDPTVDGDPRLYAVREAVRDWGGHASVDSVGFRVVHGWRNVLIRDMLSALTAEVRQRDPDWVHRSFRNESWAWPLAESEPVHLLHPRHDSWHDMKLAAVQQLLDDWSITEPTQLAMRNWGELNTAQVRHPLSQAVPALGRWLDMSPQALPGESSVPRVQTVGFGASQRMAVSPGDEQNGYFHMPGGQSGHPRSPFYGAGHDDWVEGRPTPFMPGSVLHSLQLSPDGDAEPIPIGVVLPSGDGAVAPNLATTADGGALLSWIEPVASGGHALKFSRRTPEGRWSPARVIASGDDWFVNWADFPAMAEQPGGTLVAHWLQKSGPATYAYDVMVTHSEDGGITWSPGRKVHTDDTATEHGFVSLSATGDGVRLVWLDGRETTGAGHGAHQHGEREQGMMTLRSRVLGADGALHEEALLDSSVCDCCQTATARTDDGLLVVYRNRTADEIRDIWAVRERGGVWSEPVPVHEDGWHITGCPVNGPAVAATGNSAATAWFTGADGIAQVQVAWSADGGASFGPPLRVDGGAPVGRVDLVMLDDGSAMVSWLEDAGAHAEIRVRRVREDGPVGDAIVMARSSVVRASGFPRMARVPGGLFVVWTEPGSPGGLAGARLVLPR